ncbi:unnamed protein product [Sphagnum compactum]
MAASTTDTVLVVEEVVVASETVVEEVKSEDKPEKVAKEKKVKAPKEKKPKKPKVAKTDKVSITHPPYLLMVKEAIGSLKERTGSSQYAIAKYLEDTYKTGLPPNFKKTLSIQLRNLTKQGKVFKPAIAPKAALKSKVPAATKKDEEKTAPVRKPAAVRKTAPKKVPVVKKSPKSLKTAKPKTVKASMAAKKPGKASKTAASPAKKAKK